MEEFFSEIPRGQVPIEDADFEKIPEIIYKADEIKFTGKNKIGLETITYKKYFRTISYFMLKKLEPEKKH